jgi:hypothetical protein
MKRIQGPRTLGIAILLFAGIAVSAHAQVLIQPFTIPAETANFAITVNVPQFQASLGTLQSVMITLNGTVSNVSIFLSNNLSQPQTLTAQASFTLVVADPLNQINASTTMVSTLNSGNPFTIPGGGANTYLGSSAAGSASSLTGNGIALLNEFKGSGNIAIPVSGTVTATNSINNSGITESVTSNTVGGTGTVKYTYIPVGAAPEPGTIALLVSGGICALAVKRRRAGP